MSKTSYIKGHNSVLDQSINHGEESFMRSGPLTMSPTVSFTPNHVDCGLENIANIETPGAIEVWLLYEEHDIHPLI